MYIGSERHRQNLELARLKGLKPVRCSYCHVDRSKGNIKKHERSCYMNPNNIRLCIVCQSPIKNKGNITCGYRCSNKHFRSGANNGNWKESSYRTTCFASHKKECVVCGEKLILAVHHMDENRNNNDPSNLIPMCPTHHQYWHSRYRKKIEDKVFDYIKKWKELFSKG